jgi:hypothetical protein
MVQEPVGVIIGTTINVPLTDPRLGARSRRNDLNPLITIPWIPALTKIVGPSRWPDDMHRHRYVIRQTLTGRFTCLTGTRRTMVFPILKSGLFQHLALTLGFAAFGLAFFERYFDDLARTFRPVFNAFKTRRRVNSRAVIGAQHIDAAR